MKNKYFDFLCGIVGGSHEYSHLLSKLHEVEFYSLVPNDDNREADGEQLRANFMNEVGPTGAPSLPSCGCTVLEMLIGMAYRLEFELAGGRYERPAGQWFWVLIDNLELSMATNEFFREPCADACADAFVDDRLHILLERRYFPNGNGGLFPLNRPEKDQRQVEIWYQMSAWIIENYPI